MGKISLEKYERGRVLLEFYSKFPKPELAKQLMLSFEQYIKWVHVNATGIEYDMTDSHKRVAKALQDIADGLNVKRNLALALPVGFGKSLIVQYWITWCFARNKQCMFCYIAYADKLIKKLSKEARDIIGSEFWISVFGNELRADDKSKLNFSLNSGGKRTG